MSFNSYFNLPHHWMPYVLLSYNSDGNMREYRVRQALWLSLGVTKHFADNAWLVRLSLNNLLGTKERETRYASDYIFDKSSFKDGRRISLLVRYTFKDKSAIRAKVLQVKKWIDYKSLSIYGSATKRKIKFCVMKFANIF